MSSNPIDEKPSEGIDIYAVVMKLVGQIEPVGETHADDRRFENLKDLCRVADRLVSAIDAVGYEYKDSHQFSVKRAANYAQKFMTDLGIPD